MKRHKCCIYLVIILVMSITPAYASQISGTNQSFDGAIKNVTDTQSKLNTLNSSIQGELNSLTSNANKCVPKNVPWYVWLAAACDFWAIVIYLGVYLDRVRTNANNLKDKLNGVGVIGEDLNGTRYGLEEDNNTVNSTDAVNDYVNYMEPKLENKTGYKLQSQPTGNLEVGDIVLYKSKNMYYRYLYVSNIDRAHGNYVLRGMNNKPFVKSGSDIDGNVKLKFKITNRANVTREDELNVVDASYDIQKTEFNDRRNALVELKDTSFTLTQTTEWMRGTVTLIFDGVNTAIAWLSITGLPQIITDIKDAIVFSIMMINEYIFKPLNNLSKDLISYYDLEIPDLQEYFQDFVSPYPTAHDMNFTTNNNRNLTGNLNATGSSILNYHITKSPSSGHFELMEDHGGLNSTFIYIPDQNYVGNVTFKYQVDDGLDESNEATVKLEVYPNHAPVTTSLNQSLIMDQVLNGNLNAKDPDGDPLTYMIVDGVSNGSLSIRGDGTFIYKPNQNFVGNDSFTYIATDGFLNSTKTTIHFMVDNPPVAMNMEYQLQKNTAWNISGTNFNTTDIDGDKLQFKLFKPENSLNDSSGNLTKQKMFWYFYPATNFTGIIKLEYRAFDGVFWSNPANITLIYQ